MNETHRDPQLYPDYQRFDLDRFAPNQEADKQANFGYIPFGGGLRECLGKEFARLEMRVFAAMLVANYQWELLPNQDLTMIGIPTPQLKDGLKVRFVSV
ncbi:MAG: cytochrome P450 [Gloeocapsa sp. DLM2.Bin57]|nr:MAG: cytochrome P450 [Gloeocapsa sp. DLM2.Bin57]